MANGSKPYFDQLIDGAKSLPLVERCRLLAFVVEFRDTTRVHANDEEFRRGVAGARSYLEEHLDDFDYDDDGSFDDSEVFEAMMRDGQEVILIWMMEALFEMIEEADASALRADLAPGGATL